MLKLGGPHSAPLARPLLQLAPPHMQLRATAAAAAAASAAAGAGQGRQRAPRLPHATYVQFSPQGDRLLASFHADHAYCFDVTAAGGLVGSYGAGAAAAAAWDAEEPEEEGMACARSQEAAAAAAEAGAGAGASCGGASGSSGASLPAAAQQFRVTGNAMMLEKQFAGAVEAFDQVVWRAPGHADAYAMVSVARGRRLTVLTWRCSLLVGALLHLVALQQWRARLRMLDVHAPRGA
jgi:hypothetical protein